mmetsp:Transcript_8394/g.10927  ORF Transcript_8394/g.10927 Transcript_8394/m.10927 type:complete len:258 (+) Transcript_8394:157-930(+)|eukprot:CAMPEP_0117740250 /NCGR_PEP_ID=MMETSP0947-20121206/4232_1 /TAXON_ID=44440 /ORGANISM="Chattonella subsalsa, Strain CCMP2191" /LENGTH=257 /DNA_ID=CAMNT_0005556333 /DNA_START=100 /DNA_END=873 /DNA_ORIENTATION=+
MEEFDDLIQRPDDDGCLDLAHRGWVTLDDAVWTMSLDLFVLNVSFNNIKEFPPRIKDLTLLKEIDCSCNKLKTFPAEVGQLKRLTKLKCNGNLLEALPAELSGCRLLVELIASENKIKEIPASLGELPTLKVLKLQNNDLKSLPPEIGNLLTLEEIDVAGNKELEPMIPKKMASDTKMILWTCKLHRDYRARIKQLKKSNMSLEHQVQSLQEETMKQKDKYFQLEKEKKKVEETLPTNYLSMKSKVINAKSSMCLLS